MTSSKKICITAACMALCCLLPPMFHSVGLGTALSPIHIPVLLCGIICGGGYGLVCGLIGPILSSALTGMPGPAMLATMVPELMAYGLTAGLMMGFVRTGRLYADLYIALGTAMILGRAVGGIAKVLFYLGSGETFTFALWISSYFVATLPAIGVHLVLIPVLTAMLMKARVIPNRY